MRGAAIAFVFVGCALGAATTAAVLPRLYPPPDPVVVQVKVPEAVLVKVPEIVRVPEPSPPPIVVTTRPSWPWTDKVSRAQSALNAIGVNGHTPLAVDGIAGPLTRAAVGAFQSARDIAADGIVGPKTRAAITDALPACERSVSAGGAQ